MAQALKRDAKEGELFSGQVIFWAGHFLDKSFFPAGRLSQLSFKVSLFVSLCC
jgi:hypothetical protein